MEKRKKITVAIVSVILVIAVAAGIIGIILHQQTTRYNTLMAEVASINEITSAEYASNIDREQLNELLDRRVTNGKYGEVENAFKNYMADLYQIVYDAADASSDESFAAFLSPDNIAQDGPAFENSRTTIEELMTRLETDKENYLQMTGGNAIGSYADRADLSGRYREMYDTILSAHKAIGEAGGDEFTQAIDAAIAKLAATDDVFEFLNENQSGWYMEDGTLKFRTEALYNDYSKLMESIS